MGSVYYTVTICIPWNYYKQATFHSQLWSPLISFQMSPACFKLLFLQLKSKIFPLGCTSIVSPHSKLSMMPHLCRIHWRADSLSTFTQNVLYILIHCVSWYWIVICTYTFASWSYVLFENKSWVMFITYLFKVWELICLIIFKWVNYFVALIHKAFRATLCGHAHNDKA